MSSGTLNKVMLIGNLGTDPEVKALEFGKIVKFPIATSEQFTNREGNKVERTEWHNIVVLKKGLAEICERYLRKGQKVYLEGKIQTRSWQDESGQTRYMTEINCQEMTMLSGRNETDAPSNNAQGSQSTNQSSSPKGGNDQEDDLPF